MKRKDIEEVDDCLFSPSSKSRRLDVDLFATINEDPRSAAQVFEEMPPPVPSVMQTDDLPKDPLPSEDEKALVVYHRANTPFFKTPDSPDFSLIVNSDLIPGLRDHINSWGNPKSLKPLRYHVAEEEKTEASDGCMAVVPWVPSNLTRAPRDETQAEAASVPEPEAEQVEMMDTDESYSGVEVSKFGGMAEGYLELQHWQQPPPHWMETQLHQNNYTPVT